MAQSMEHWIKFMKRHLRNNCNSRYKWRNRLMQFMDCLTVGAVGYNLIDFKHCLNKYLQATQMIYNPTTTPMIESNLLCAMPDTFFEYYQKVNQIQFGDDIPQDLSRIWNQHLQKHQQIEAMKMYVNNSSAFEMIDDYSSWDEEEEQGDNLNFNGISKISKTQMLQLMQQFNQDN